LPVISKIFEKILYEQLYEYFTTNNLLSEQQFGFRLFNSTSTALLDCTDEWYVNMDRGLYNLAVFLDLKKAFDTVNHDILLAKLELYGIKNTPLMLFKSYLSDRSQQCQVNVELSTLKYLKYGVPQGSILGSLLFLIYINDLPNCLQHSTACMFTDDTNITVSGKSIKEAEVAVNADLNNITEWLLSNRLSLNLVKTEYLLIGSRHNINMLEEPIKGVQVTKTLGVKIDQFLTWAFLEESIDENWNSWKDVFLQQ
jgi:retron-type reverse transcriptase